MRKIVEVVGSYQIVDLSLAVRFFPISLKYKKYIKYVENGIDESVII